MPTTSKSPPATPTVKKPATRLPQAAGGAALDQALQVRDALRAQLAAVKELIRTLRSERQGRRRLKSTLASLKNLQQVA